MSTREPPVIRDNSAAVADAPPRAESAITRALGRLRRTPLWPLLSLASVAASQVVAMVFTLLRSKVIAVSLGPAGVGVIALLDQIVVLGSQVCIFGITTTATKFLSAAHSDGEEAFSHAYWTFLRVVLLLSLIGALGTAAFLQWRAPAGEMMGFAVIVALGVIPMNGAVTIQNAMAASRRFREAATYGLVNTVALCCVSAAATAMYGVRGYYFGSLFAMAAMFAGGAAYMGRLYTRGSWFRSALPDLYRYQTAVASAAVLYLSSLSAPLSDLVPRYVMSRAHGVEATGLLQAVFGLALTVRTIVRPSFGLFLIPTLNRRTSPADKVRDAASFTRVMFTLTAIAALMLVLFPAFWLSTLYTSRFAVVAPWLYLFLIGIAIQLIGTVYLQLLFALEELRAFVLIAVSGDILTCVITALLVPSFGIPAVAMGLIADGLVMCGAAAWLLRRRHGLNLARAAGLLPAVALAFLVVAGLTLAPASRTIFSTVMRVALWLAGSVVLLWWLRRTSGGILDAAPVRPGNGPVAGGAGSGAAFARD